MFKSTEKFIVSPKDGHQYINTKNVGDKELVINTSIEHAKDVNRTGVVKALPLGYSGNIRVSDEVIVQHNVFRDYFNGSCITKKSDYHLKNDLFFVQEELIFLIIRNGEKISVDEYCFIKPVFEEKKWVGEVEVKHTGIVKYGNKILEEQGVNEGDTIFFKEECEYVVPVDGEVLYRMRSDRVLGKFFPC